MVAIAVAIIRRRTGNFDPSIYRDRYQEALQQLIEAKMKGLTIKPRPLSTPSPVIDLMAALKRSLAQEPSAPEQRAAKSKQAKQIPDRRQPAVLLPLASNRKTKRRLSAEPAVTKRSRGAGTSQSFLIYAAFMLPLCGLLALIIRRLRRPASGDT